MRRAAAALATAVFGLCAEPAAAAPGPNDAPEYWFDSWHVESLWQDGVRGQGITIAEIDTGVNAHLPELRGRVLPGRVFGSHGNGQVDRLNNVEVVSIPQPSTGTYTVTVCADHLGAGPRQGYALVMTGDFTSVPLGRSRAVRTR